MSGSTLIHTPIDYGGIDHMQLSTFWNVNAINVVAMPDNTTSNTRSLYLGASKDVVLQASEDVRISLGSSNTLRIHDDMDIATFLLTTTPTATNVSSASKNLVIGTADDALHTTTIAATTISQSNDYEVFETSMGSGFRLRDNNLYVEGFGTFEDSLSVGGNIHCTSNVFSRHYNLYRYAAPNDSRSAILTGYAFTINSNDQLELVKYTSFSNAVTGPKEIKKRVAVFGTTRLSTTDTTDISYAEFENISADVNNGGNAAFVTGVKIADASVTSAKIDTTSIGLWGVSGSNVYFSTSSNESAGSVGIGIMFPEYKLDVNGNIHARKSITSSSDARLKTNLIPIPDAIAKIATLTGYTYNRVDFGNREAGLTAQQVQAALPEVVHEDSHGMLSVAYGNMMALVVQALKEMNDKIDKLALAMP